MSGAFSAGLACVAAALAGAAVAQPNVPDSPPPERVLSQKDVTFEPFHPDPSMHFYPDGARERFIKGEVFLICDISDGGALSCAVESEDPPKFGFGASAMDIFSRMRVKPTTKSGAPVAGRKVRVDMKFNLEG